MVLATLPTIFYGWSCLLLYAAPWNEDVCVILSGVRIDMHTVSRARGWK